MLKGIQTSTKLKPLFKGRKSKQDELNMKQLRKNFLTKMPLRIAVKERNAKLPSLSKSAITRETFWTRGRSPSVST